MATTTTTSYTTTSYPSSALEKGLYTIPQGSLIRDRSSRPSVQRALHAQTPSQQDQQRVTSVPSSILPSTYRDVSKETSTANRDTRLTPGRTAGVATTGSLHQGELPTRYPRTSPLYMPGESVPPSVHASATITDTMSSTVSPKQLDQQQSKRSFVSSKQMSSRNSVSGRTSGSLPPQKYHNKISRRQRSLSPIPEGRHSRRKEKKNKKKRDVSVSVSSVSSEATSRSRRHGSRYQKPRKLQATKKNERKPEPIDDPTPTYTTSESTTYTATPSDKVDRRAKKKGLTTLTNDAGAKERRATHDGSQAFVAKHPPSVASVSIRKGPWTLATRSTVDSVISRPPSVLDGFSAVGSVHTVLSSRSQWGVDSKYMRAIRAGPSAWPDHILAKHPDFDEDNVASPYTVFYFDETAPNDILIANDVKPKEGDNPVKERWAKFWNCEGGREMTVEVEGDIYGDISENDPGYLPYPHEEADAVSSVTSYSVNNSYYTESAFTSVADTIHRPQPRRLKMRRGCCGAGRRASSSSNLGTIAQMERSLFGPDSSAERSSIEPRAAHSLDIEPEAALPKNGALLAGHAENTPPHAIVKYSRMASYDYIPYDQPISHQPEKTPAFPSASPPRPVRPKSPQRRDRVRHLFARARELDAAHRARLIALPPYYPPALSLDGRHKHSTADSACKEDRASLGPSSSSILPAPRRYRLQKTRSDASVHRGRSQETPRSMRNAKKVDQDKKVSEKRQHKQTDRRRRKADDEATASLRPERQHTKTDSTVVSSSQPRSKQDKRRHHQRQTVEDETLPSFRRHLRDVSDSFTSSSSQDDDATYSDYDDEESVSRTRSSSRRRGVPSMMTTTTTLDQTSSTYTTYTSTDPFYSHTESHEYRRSRHPCPICKGRGHISRASTASHREEAPVKKRKFCPDCGLFGKQPARNLSLSTTSVPTFRATTVSQEPSPRTATPRTADFDIEDEAVVSRKSTTETQVTTSGLGETLEIDEALLDSPEPLHLTEHDSASSAPSFVQQLQPCTKPERHRNYSYHLRKCFFDVNQKIVPPSGTRSRALPQYSVSYKNYPEICYDVVAPIACDEFFRSKRAPGFFV